MRTPHRRSSHPLLSPLRPRWRPKPRERGKQERGSSRRNPRPSALRAPPPGHGASPRRRAGPGRGEPRTAPGYRPASPSPGAARWRRKTSSRRGRRRPQAPLPPPSLAAGARPLWPPEAEEAPRLRSGKCPPRGRADRAEPPRKRREPKELPGRRRRPAQPPPRGAGGRGERALPGPGEPGLRGGQRPAGEPLSPGGGVAARGHCPCSVSSPSGVVRNAGSLTGAQRQFTHLGELFLIFILVCTK